MGVVTFQTAPPTKLSAKRPWAIQRAALSRADGFGFGEVFWFIAFLSVPRVGGIVFTRGDRTHDQLWPEGGTLKLLSNGKWSAKFDAECLAMRELLTRVGDKWSVFAIVLLGNGAMRFNALKRALGGISQKVLTATLRGLERDGLIERTVYPTNPPQVDYKLTKLGRALLKPLSALAVWAHGHRAEVRQARETFDVGRKR
jgi:DNA-binding HxlR family transcriptional regulator